MGDTTILGVEYGSANDARENRLVALDVATGDRRVLHQGPLAGASPSPDGTLVLLVEPHEPDWAGLSVELRPLGAGGLGEPIARIDDRFVGAAVWAPDSGRVYLSLISDEELGPPPGRQWSAQEPRSVERVDVAALDRDGRIHRLTAIDVNQYAQMLSVSPDGQRVIYQLLTIPGQAAARLSVSLWETRPDGSQRRAIAADLPGRSTALSDLPGRSTALWSPDGRTLLLAGLSPFYLVSDPTIPGAGEDGSQSLVAVEPDGTRRVMAASLTGFGGQPIHWLPPEAIPPRPASTPPPAPVAPQPPEPVPGLPAGLRTGPVDRTRGDGYSVVLWRDDAPLVWSRGGHPPLRLDPADADLDWFGTDPALLGVVRQPPGRPGTGSRLTLTVTGPRVTEATDLQARDTRYFDPAGIGDDPTRRYARPRAAPDGRTTAFFVVDEARGRVALWLVGWDLPAREVAAWPVPAARGGEVPPVAAWVDAGTLVYAAPEAWRDGLPQRVTLHRLTLDGVETAPLLTLRAHGAERGIAVTDLAPAPDGAGLAVRVRHYGSGAAADSLHLAPARDVTLALEATRGAAAEGLAWSPDGRWLAAALDDRVLLLTADGRRLVSLTAPAAAAEYPLWVARDEVWFTLDDGSGPRVMRVRLR